MQAAVALFADTSVLHSCSNTGGSSATVAVVFHLSPSCLAAYYTQDHGLMGYSTTNSTQRKHVLHGVEARRRQSVRNWIKLSLA
jgi:hypothetical protein